MFTAICDTVNFNFLYTAYGVNFFGGDLFSNLSQSNVSQFVWKCIHFSLFSKVLETVVAFSSKNPFHTINH